MKTATLIPTYPGHFEYGLSLLKSFREYSNNDIFFVFSNVKDFEDFDKLTNLKYNHVILSDDVLSGFGSIITLKKIYGLKEIINDYDYVGVFDCETVFVKNFDSDVIYHDIFNKKYFKSNTSNLGGRLIFKTAEMIGLSNNERLAEQTLNYTQYWWFNEICVYEKNTFLDFLKFYENLTNIVDIKNDVWCFDYLMYSIWLICFKEFDVKPYATYRDFHFGAIEHNNEDSISLEFDSYIDHNKNHSISDKIKVLIHLDRV